MAGSGTYPASRRRSCSSGLQSREYTWIKRAPGWSTSMLVSLISSFLSPSSSPLVIALPRCMNTVWLDLSMGRVLEVRLLCSFFCIVFGVSFLRFRNQMFFLFSSTYDAEAIFWRYPIHLWTTKESLDRIIMQIRLCCLVNSLASSSFFQVINSIKLQ